MSRPELPLNRYLQRRASLSALLVGFSLPAIGLLLFFLWILSHVTAQFQQEEVAILASRGAGRRFVAFLILLETLLLLAVGIPLGLGAGYVMARAMGLASGFLVFTPRAGIPATLLEVDWRLIGLALLLLVLARGIPALRAARGGIVQHLRSRSRPHAAITTLLLAGDGALIVLTWYAYRQLSQRGTLGIIGWEPSGDPFRDPLLLLAPSLFVFTSALVLTPSLSAAHGAGRSPGQPPPLLRRLHGPHPTAPPGQTLLRQHLPDNGLPQPRRLLRLHGPQPRPVARGPHPIPGRRRLPLSAGHTSPGDGGTKRPRERSRIRK